MNLKDCSFNEFQNKVQNYSASQCKSVMKEIYALKGTLKNVTDMKFIDTLERKETLLHFLLSEKHKVVNAHNQDEFQKMKMRAMGKKVF